MKVIAMANPHMDVPELDPKNLPEWSEELPKFVLSLVSNTLT